MATYVTSDLHGMSLARFLALLDRAHFTDDDLLFILGDVVDREGDGGVGILKWLLCAKNAYFLLGNHEECLLACEFAFEEVTESAIDAMTGEMLETLLTYSREGGDVTLAALRQVAKEDPETLREIFDYLKDAPLWDEVEAGGRTYVLCHAGLGGFSPEKELSDYTVDELLWFRPSGRETYFPDKTVVFGHTPTALLGARGGDVLFGEGFIGIDVGVASGKRAVLLRLDDLAVFREEE
ncbi:MAG: metallophosphoesterase [Clostridia bacterium]|nr:metallophosphoesterase [Clostridia bacterium]